MAGSPQNREKLNKTLKYITEILNRYEIENWCISYGTLLGIIRDGSCIDGDDDIDILIPKNQVEKLHDAMEKEGIGTSFNSKIRRGKNRDKTIHTRPGESKVKSHAKIDFYFCEVDESGNYDDLWEKVVWSNCLDEETGKIPYVIWEGLKVNVPCNYEEKLLRRYGPTWRKRIPRGTEAGDGYRGVKIL